MLTGHSLGGGLAGFLSLVYGNEAVIFDLMSYLASAQELARMLPVKLIDEKFDNPEAQAIIDNLNATIQRAHDLFSEKLSSYTIQQLQELGKILPLTIRPLLYAGGARQTQHALTFNMNHIMGQAIWPSRKVGCKDGGSAACSSWRTLLIKECGATTP